MWKFSVYGLLASSAIALNLYHQRVAQAQITPDNSLGSQSSVGRVLKVGEMLENTRLTYSASIHDSSSEPVEVI